MNSGVNWGCIGLGTVCVKICFSYLTMMLLLPCDLPGASGFFRLGVNRRPGCELAAYCLHLLQPAQGRLKVYQRPNDPVLEDNVTAWACSITVWVTVWLYAIWCLCQCFSLSFFLSFLNCGKVVVYCALFQSACSHRGSWADFAMC